IVDLADSAISDGAINISILAIAIIAAATQYYMSRQLLPHSESKKGFREIMSEAAEGKQADQAEMNALVMSKMTRVFPIIMLIIMIGLPGALVLYYAVSNLVAVVQQTHILKHDEEALEELAEAAPVQNTKTQIKKSTKPSTTAPMVTRITAKDTR